MEGDDEGVQQELVADGLIDGDAVSSAAGSLRLGGQSDP